MKEITKTSANRNRHRKQTALPPRRSAIHRILVPIDFSPASLCALDYGADRARELGATIILVHVLDPILVERRFVAPRLRAMKAETRLIKKKLLFLAKRRVATGTPVRPWLLNGEPSSAIIQAAAKTESDLIIMGSAGTKGFRRMLLGSVAHRVVRDAGCPVTIVPVPRSKNHKPPRLRLGAEGGERAAIVLMGSPGSGKTTLARALAERTPISIIEAGNLLKAQVRQGSKLGKTIEPFTSGGKLAPLPQVIETISRALKKVQKETVLFDGMPRSTEQSIPFLELLAEHGLNLRAVIILKLDLQTALRRLTGRRICSRCGAIYQAADSDKTCARCGGELIQRQDDRKETVRERFKRFERETMPVIRFFKKEFVHLTWELSATDPQEKVVDLAWRHLERTITHIGSRKEQKPVARKRRAAPAAGVSGLR